jgi:hypothetical protein
MNITPLSEGTSMWKFIIVLGSLLVLLSPELHAARCKVDGVWYDYDSPQCSPQSSPDKDKTATSVSPTLDESVASQPSNEASTISPVIAQGLMTSYLRPWPEVAYLAEQRCKGRTSPPSGLDCLLREENGYWAMRGNFMMPESDALHAKTICAATTESFGSQMLCMHNESIGYTKFTVKSEMPDEQAIATRTECQKQYDSWSQRGSCVSSAISRFKNPNGLTKRSRSMRAFSSGVVEAPLGYVKESEVVTFRVHPVKEHNVGKMEGPPLTWPQPLNTRQRAARLALNAADPDVLDTATEALDTEADYFVLTAEAPRVEGIATLGFLWPANVGSDSGVRLTDEEDSSVGLGLTLEKGRVYLVDFVVRAFTEGSYELAAGSETHIFEDLGGAIRNLTVRLIPEASGNVGLRLKRPQGRGFYFHAAAITSIEATGLFEPGAQTSATGRLPEQLEAEDL